jgi:hypothetical protein
MESADDDDPGPHSSFAVVNSVAIPSKSIVIKTVRAQEPYVYTDTTGKTVSGKMGDTRVEVLRESSDGPHNILWLERGWRSKRQTSNFMKAFLYAQRVEQLIRMEDYAISPEVIDRDLLRRVV